jgi:hypothetical protein
MYDSPNKNMDQSYKKNISKRPCPLEIDILSYVECGYFIEQNNIISSLKYSLVSKKETTTIDDNIKNIDDETIYFHGPVFINYNQTMILHWNFQIRTDIKIQTEKMNIASF